jgi:hypothetical protein
MQTATAGEQTWSEATPMPTREPYSIYYASHNLPRLEWIIQGTDRKLYIVPAEAGG